MLDRRLVDFVEAAKAKGVGDESLVALMRQQGWQERIVYQALGEYYARTLGVAVPARGSRAENAREAFLYLLSFIALGAWVFALIQLGDVLVDRFLHVYQPFNAYVDDRSTISNYVATLIVAFPIQVWVGALIAREAQRRPEALESGIRKWLTYIALVVTAVVLLSDAIWFLSDFLGGELTLAFVLKTIVLVALTGGVFWYYLGNVRRDDLSITRDRLFVTAAAAAVIAGIVGGFVPLGTPEHHAPKHAAADATQTR